MNRQVFVEIVFGDKSRLSTSSVWPFFSGLYPSSWENTWRTRAYQSQEWCKCHIWSNFYIPMYSWKDSKSLCTSFSTHPLIQASGMGPDILCFSSGRFVFPRAHIVHQYSLIRLQGSILILFLILQIWLWWREPLVQALTICKEISVINFWHMVPDLKTFPKIGMV